MGEFRFKVPVDWPLDPYHGNSIHIIGLDGIPWPCRVSVGVGDDDQDLDDDQRLVIVHRNQAESGKLYVLFDFDQRGEHLICTGMLPPENDEAYDLILELARGTLNRLRNQLSIWEEGGLLINESIAEKLAEATGLFGEAVFAAAASERTRFAQQSIQSSASAMYLLADAFAVQISQVRREHPEIPKFWIANQIGSGSQLDNSFELSCSYLIAGRLATDLNNPRAPSGSGLTANEEGPAITRQQFESSSKRAIVGPLLDASIGGMDQRLMQADDFLARKDLLVARMQQTLRQMPDNISMLHVVSGLNGTGHRHLSYPQQLQATVDLLSVVDESPTDVPTMVSFDFPWAERLAGAVGGVHPLQIADSLLRQGVTVNFLGLDVNLDYWPNGSAIRDPLQWIDLVDIWAQLGLPLVLNLRLPCGQIDRQRQGDQSKNQICSNLTERQRIDYLNTILPMLASRPAVSGLIFRQWQDADDLRYPFAGLIDRDGQEKAIFEILEPLHRLIENDQDCGVGK